MVGNTPIHRVQPDPDPVGGHEAVIMIGKASSATITSQTTELG